MKNKIKYILITIVVIAIVAGISVFVYNTINDKNKITVEEKKWINNNISNLQSVNIVNDVDVFSHSGYGVYYDFISDFSKEYQIKINPITYNVDDEEKSDGFKITNKLDDNSVVFYEDYYVLISKKAEHINNINSIDGNIGNLSGDFSYLSSYLPNAKLISYNSYSELEEAFVKNEAIKYMIVPRIMYIDYTIKNDYEMVYHFSDIKEYFIYQMKNDDPFSSIIKKYFNVWKKDHLDNSININMLNDLTINLGLSEKDVTAIKSKVYKYGFINNSPYEVLIGGNYGGIVSEYLKKFSNLTGVEFKFTKYKNYNAFVSAINNNEVDLYFNYYLGEDSYKAVDTGMNVNYVVIAKNTNDLIVNSMSSLQNKSVYLLENSVLINSISSTPNVLINTYKTTDELKKIARKDNIIILDKETFNYLSNNDLSDYTIRYTGSTSSSYNFKVKEDDAFYKLFNRYIMTQDPEHIRLLGLYNHQKTVKKGSIFSQIATYLLIIVVSVGIIIYILYKQSKKIKISKKIKKEDKIKFIDQLTSLKNRNYLNENIDGWNKNRIYPQATIIIDLNRVQEINDIKGYDEGDKQIKAASNILIRTQLDNSDIMRTDGNEFLVYTVGYDKRAIESYIRKLIKEFKSLPFDYGAIITYSMIEDDLITIEDAINDAVDKMKEKKQEI